MNLIFLGPPGSGKGTQAKRLYAEFRVPQISTGDILREAVRTGTELGRKAKPIMEAAQLVPDALVVGIVEERLRQPDCAEGWVLDGFPRTVAQAEALERMLAEAGKRVDQVISLEVPRAELIERQTGRRSCPKCHSIYHVTLSPPRTPGICDRDGEILIQREDDKLERATARQDVYERETAPLKQHYAQKNLLRTVNGMGSPEQIFANIRQLIGR